jgi:hypothetical protein
MFVEFRVTFRDPEQSRKTSRTIRISKSNTQPDFTRGKHTLNQETLISSGIFVKGTFHPYATYAHRAEVT